MKKFFLVFLAIVCLLGILLPAAYTYAVLSDHISIGDSRDASLGEFILGFLFWLGGLSISSDIIKKMERIVGQNN